MQSLPAFSDPDLLIGAESFSDAGIYRLRDDLAIVQSTDFFSPLVDDPFVFGQIAAANSMSDIFAMGGEVRTALNIVCFPDNEADISILTEILRGGAERVSAAGGVVLGGHSVRDREIKYGLAVTGIVNPERMITNRGAKPGDVLVLTKALGTGYVTTALRHDKCPDDVLEAACESMTQLNDAASREAVRCGANAITDITGFGLAGHAFELAEASRVTVEVELNRLPMLPGALELAEKGNLTRANATNLAYVEKSMEVVAGVDLSATVSGFLFDPQTSGGLLVSLPEGAVEGFISGCEAAGLGSGGVRVIGSVCEAEVGVGLRIHP